MKVKLDLLDLGQRRLYLPGALFFSALAALSLGSCTLPAPEPVLETSTARLAARRQLLELFDRFSADVAQKANVESFKDMSDGKLCKIHAEFWKLGRPAYFAFNEKRWDILPGKTEIKIPDDGYVFVELKKPLDPDLLADFRGVEIIGNDAQTEEILASLAGTSIKALSLREMTFSKRALALLNELKQIESLSIYDCHSPFFDDIDTRRLSYLDAKFLSEKEYAGLLKKAINLKFLTLKDAALEAQVLNEIAGKKELEVLRLNDSDLNDEGLAHVIASKKNLYWLECHASQISNNGLKHLSSLKNLKKLNVSRCDIGDEGISYLLNCKGLESLDLGNTNVTDKSIELLLKLPKLDNLNLENTQVTKACLETLTRFPSLKGLNINGLQNVSIEELRSFQRRLKQKDCIIK
ncbi:MAG: hypothetical protein K2X27_13445 [Candidatus Obscuribacterales bacterium]|nr:hypothetical protein [Candidatus Obscuribacterales bacterium]